MTRCTDREAKRALEALFRGELEAEGFARLRAHAAACAGCREAYDRLSRVESALEKRALPSGREALLERELFARLEAAKRPARAPVPERKRRFPVFFVPAALGLAVCAALLVVLVPRLEEERPVWQARGGEAGSSAWGVRAFCIGPDGRVLGEAGSGGTLGCGEGNAVQFSYTAPEAARLAVRGRSPGGEPLLFFPSEGPAAEVEAGVDVPLPYSTPVRGGWLSGPVEVTARFEDPEGRPLSETTLRLTP